MQRILHSVLCLRMLLSVKCAIVDPSGKTHLFSNMCVGLDTVAYYIYEDKVKAVGAVSGVAWDDINICDPLQSLEIEPQSPVVNIAESGAEAWDDISEMVFSPGKQPVKAQSDVIELANLSYPSSRRLNV